MLIFSELQKKILLITFCLLIITILTIFWHKYIILRFPNIVIDDGSLNYESLQFFFAGIVKNLIEVNKYEQELFGLKFYLSRMPIIPFIIKWIYLYISKNFLIILLIKNYLIFISLLLILYKILKKNFLVLGCFFLFIYNPYNLITLLRLIPEEGIISIFITILYLSITKKEIDFRLVTLSLVIIYFTKASQLLLCYLLPFILIFENQNKNKYLPLIFIILSYICWGSFSYYKSQKFVSPLSISSLSGLTLSVVYNEKFNDVYPFKSPDILLKDIMYEKKNELKKVQNEFEFNKIFSKEIIQYVKENEKFFFESIKKKLYVLFLNVKYDSQDESSNKFKKIRITEIPNKILFNISILIAIFSIIKKSNNRVDNYYLLIIILYLIPYLIGFIYTRHLVPLYILSNVYLFLKYIRLRGILNG